MTAIDLCQGNYQALLISYLELTIKNANLAWKKKIKSECDFIELKSNRLNYKCKESGKKCSQLINEVIKNFSITYQFCNGNVNKCVLLLRKCVYSYEYMDIW